MVAMPRWAGEKLGRSHANNRIGCALRDGHRRERKCRDQGRARHLQDGDTTLKGFVVYDDASTAKRPGLIMVHEWWGITNHMHNQAKLFVQQGYTVLIADMYGDAQTADNPKDAD